MVLSLAYIDHPWRPAEEFLFACVHDTDETVFVKAFRICGRLRNERAIDHLLAIVKTPSGALRSFAAGRLSYPVGHAAGNICAAEAAILGTDDPELAAQRESELRR